MKYLIYFITLLSVSCQPCHAEQSIDWYGKVAYNYILEQAAIAGGHQFQNNSYSLEAGIEVDPDGWESYRFGLYYFDQIGLDSVSQGRYDPQFIEVFGEKSWNLQDGCYGRIGWGYKLSQDTEIDNLNGNYKPVIESMTDRLSARFSVGKKIGKVELELSHHSNWMVGKPFNNRWEYHYTGISIGYVFK